MRCVARFVYFNAKDLMSKYKNYHIIDRKVSIYIGQRGEGKKNIMYKGNEMRKKKEKKEKEECIVRKRLIPVGKTRYRKLIAPPFCSRK